MILSVKREKYDKLNEASIIISTSSPKALYVGAK